MRELGADGKGLEAQLRHFEIPKKHEHRCLEVSASVKGAWLVGTSIRNLVPILVAAPMARKAFQHESPDHWYWHDILFQ